MKNSGKYLKDLRIKAGLAMSEIAEMTGGKVDKTTLSRIERNERGVSLKVAYYLSLVYGVSIEEIAEKECGKARIKKTKTTKKKQGRKKKK